MYGKEGTNKFPTLCTGTYHSWIVFFFFFLLNTRTITLNKLNRFLKSTNLKRNILIYINILLRLESWALWSYYDYYFITAKLTMSSDLKRENQLKHFSNTIRTNNPSVYDKPFCFSLFYIKTINWISFLSFCALFE